MPILEQVPYRELDLARSSETLGPAEGVEELSEGGRRQEVCVRRRRQLKPVDDVVDLDPQLQFLVVRQRYVLEERRVYLNEMRAALGIASKVAECAGCRIRERGWIEPAGRSIDIADVIDVAHDVGTLIRGPSSPRSR